MTLKTVSFNSNGQPQKMEGWFSWRHRTRDAHDVASGDYRAQHGRAARKTKAEQRRVAVRDGAVEVSRWGCGHVSSSADHPCAIRPA